MLRSDQLYNRIIQLKDRVLRDCDNIDKVGSTEYVIATIEPARLIQDLDNWLSNGGVIPMAWNDAAGCSPKRKQTNGPAY